MKQKSTKRIVSKRDYVNQLGNKAGTSVFGLILLFFCVVGILTALMLIIALCLSGQYSDSVFFFLIATLIGIGACYLGYLGQRTLKEARQIDVGLPLTRANTGDLPAPDSLVRASHEPLQAQQSVLLRAAVETTQEQEDQLLRASAGSQE